MSKGEHIIKGVKRSIRSEDDTLYCNPKHYDYLENEFSVSSRIGISSAEEITIFGLTVQPMSEKLKRPILCQKGDVFPLAKDWKNGQIQTRNSK